jgi:hypothetical protein
MNIQTRNNNDDTISLREAYTKINESGDSAEAKKIMKQLKPVVSAFGAYSKDDRGGVEVEAIATPLLDEIAFVFQATWNGKKDKPVTVTIGEKDFDGYLGAQTIDKVAEMYYDRVI